MRQITSVSNPAIKALRGLHERKHRRQTGLFLAEGVRIVTEAADLGWPIETLVFLDGRDTDPMIRRLIDHAASDNADIIAVTAPVLAKISRKDNPQMVAASFSERWADPDQAFAASSGAGLRLIGCVIRAIWARSCATDAVGASGVMLIGDCCDAFSVETVRASMGAVFNVPMLRLDEATFLEKRQSWQGQVIGTALPASVDYRDADWVSRCCC